MGSSVSKTAYLASLDIARFIRENYKHGIFVTLTFPYPHVFASEHAPSYQCWLKVRRWLVVHGYRGIGVWERQRNGNWHFHFVTNRFLPFEIFQRVVVSAGFGEILFLESFEKYIRTRRRKTSGASGSQSAAPAEWSNSGRGVPEESSNGRGARCEDRLSLHARFDSAGDNSRRGAPDGTGQALCPGVSRREGEQGAPRPAARSSGLAAPDHSQISAVNENALWCARYLTKYLSKSFDEKRDSPYQLVSRFGSPSPRSGTIRFGWVDGFSRASRLGAAEFARLGLVSSTTDLWRYRHQILKTGLSLLLRLDESYFRALAARSGSSVMLEMLFDDSLIRRDGCLPPLDTIEIDRRQAFFRSMSSRLLAPF
jgi:hypothetical protein